MASFIAIDHALKSLYWLGHSAFRLDSSIGSIYFDPFQISSGPKAAIILVSHDHFDHCASEDIVKILGPETIIITEPLCAARLGNSKIQLMKPGEIIEIKGVVIKAVPAYNVDKQFHPKSNNWLGFIVIVDGIAIYHSGDTDYMEELAGITVDIALLPVSGTYVMSAAQAVEAAKTIRPRLAIPMHYGTIVGEERDAQFFAQALHGVIPVKILSKSNN